MRSCTGPSSSFYLTFRYCHISLIIGFLPYAQGSVRSVCDEFFPHCDLRSVGSRGRRERREAGRTREMGGVVAFERALLLSNEERR